MDSVVASEAIDPGSIPGARTTAGQIGRTRVDFLGSADMMSDMKTFTVRDLDRSPAVVLDASRADGCVRIRERGGKTYLITPEAPPQKRISELPEFSVRRGKLLKGTLPPALVRELDRALAGE